MSEFFCEDPTSAESPVSQVIGGERKARAELQIKATVVRLLCISKEI